MNYEITESFWKDAKSLSGNKAVFNKLNAVISEVEKAVKLQDIRNIKKLKGFDNVYRIRLGQYRLGCFLDGNTLILSRLLHRNNIYNKFP